MIKEVGCASYTAYGLILSKAREMPDPAQVPVANIPENLVGNPSFEIFREKKLECYWYLEGPNKKEDQYALSLTEDAHSGKHAAKIIDKGRWTSRVPVKPGKKYELKYFVKAEAVFNANSFVHGGSAYFGRMPIEPGTYD